MTISIAAICSDNGHPMIVGASDRRFTVDDWTYEPPQWKGQELGEQVFMIISGTISTHSEVLAHVSRQLRVCPTTDVADIANLYAYEFGQHRLREAEAQLLRPIGQTLSSFTELPEEQVQSLRYELRNFQLNDSAIVAGLDQEGAHVFRVVDPGVVWREDAAAFAVIGSGARHAAAEFMRAKYQRGFSVARALLLTYRAKRAAEIDPYVGTETDMFVVGPGASRVSQLDGDLFGLINGVHDRMEHKISELVREGDKEIETCVRDFLAKKAQGSAVREEHPQLPDDSKGTDADGSLRRLAVPKRG